MKREVEYFEKPGPQNSETCIDIVESLVNEGLKDVVIASTSGKTGLLAARRLKGTGANLVVVGHNIGFREPNQNEFAQEAHKEIVELGGHIYRGTILTHSLETGLAAKFSGTYPTILIANTLRRLGQGIKVCCEIVMEACDGGLIREGKHVVAVAGTVKGADTVAIVKSAVSSRFLDLYVSEILAKPL
ncbi:MAG: pyruvate kinase alpha/beta domain-containing protein [Pseudomonadota bacterium]